MQIETTFFDVASQSEIEVNQNMLLHGKSIVFRF